MQRIRDARLAFLHWPEVCISSRMFKRQTLMFESTGYGGAAPRVPGSIALELGNT